MLDVPVVRSACMRLTRGRGRKEKGGKFPGHRDLPFISVRGDLGLVMLNSFLQLLTSRAADSEILLCMVSVEISSSTSPLGLPPDS